MPRATRRRGREVLELVDLRDAPPDAPHDGPPDAPRAATAVSPEPASLPEIRVPESFESFYVRELPRLRVLARALAGDLAAEDIAQDAMVVAYRRWAHIASLQSPTGYVRSICAHQAVSAVRRSVAERKALRRLADSEPVCELAPLPADSERFWAEVRRLPRRQAQVAALFYALDLSLADVADTLGCAEGTVKSHLSRARRELGSRLEMTEDPS